MNQTKSAGSMPQKTGSCNQKNTKKAPKNLNFMARVGVFTSQRNNEWGPHHNYPCSGRLNTRRSIAADREPMKMPAEWASLFYSVTVESRVFPCFSGHRAPRG